MIPGGPDPFGDASDEPDGPDDDPAGAGGSATGGWVPPADRAWRHPSELGMGGGWNGAPGRANSPLPTAPVFPQRSRLHRVASVGVLTVAAVAVAVGSLLLVSTGEGPGTPESSSQPAVAGPVTAAAHCCTFTAAAVHRTEQSIVALVGSTSPEALVGCGVVVAGAGLVVTTADAVNGRRTLGVVTPGGRHLVASVMAVDHESDVAVLSVPTALPVARFAGDGNVGAGFPAATMVVDPGSAHRTPQVRSWRVRVASVGTAVTQGTGADMAAIMVRSHSPAVAGEPLYDAQGEVIGLLDGSAVTGRAGATSQLRPFLPAPLVVGVAHQLATTGKIEHGWLGLQARDATSGDTATSATTSPTGAPTTTSTTTTTRASTTPGRTATTSTASTTPGRTATPGGTSVTGARVIGVDPGGAAEGVLLPGDVIVALDGQPVRTMAELRDRLYVLPPDTRATITALRGGRPVTEVVDLAPSP